MNYLISSRTEVIIVQLRVNFSIIFIYYYSTIWNNIIKLNFVSYKLYFNFMIISRLNWNINFAMKYIRNIKNIKNIKIVKIIKIIWNAQTLRETSIIKGYIFGNACRHTLNTCLAPYHDISVCANFLAWLHIFRSGLPNPKPHDNWDLY